MLELLGQGFAEGTLLHSSAAILLSNLPACCAPGPLPQGIAGGEETAALGWLLVPVLKVLVLLLLSRDLLHDI